MKTNAMIQRSLAAIVVAGLLFTAACKKEKTDLPADPSDEAQEMIDDNSAAETFSTDAQNMADQTHDPQAESPFRKGGPEDNDYTFMSPCASITRDSATKTITIDFGSSFCFCKDKRYRKGIVTIKHIGGNFYTDQGAKREISFTDFHVGRDTIYKAHQVIGTHTITNKGLNSANHLNWEISANLKVIKDKDLSKWHTWVSNRNREWFIGDNTPKNWKDDVFHITGSADGANSKGKNFHAQITSPLERAMDCPWFRSGVLELTPGGKATRTIDYANNSGQVGSPNGGCDPFATFSINGKSYLINLP
jgi:hypothetical protein